MYTSPQGSVLGPVLFIIYINDIDLGLRHFISTFADDTKIGNALLIGDRLSLQDLCKISDWSMKRGMSFNINKCQILHVGFGKQCNDSFIKAFLFLFIYLFIFFLFICLLFFFFTSWSVALVGFPQGPGGLPKPVIFLKGVFCLVRLVRLTLCV